MRPLTVPDAENVILALQDEIRRSDESRYDHRLHGLLLVAQGMTAPSVGRILGDSTRTVQYWVRRFDEEGLSGLAEGDRPGRPRRTTEAQMRSIEAALRKTPGDVGLSGTLWDGKTLSAYVERQFHVDLGVRQCQRLFRQLGFRLRKPHPRLAAGDPIDRDACLRGNLGWDQERRARELLPQITRRAPRQGRRRTPPSPA